MIYIVQINIYCIYFLNLHMYVYLYIYIKIYTVHTHSHYVNTNFYFGQLIAINRFNVTTYNMSVNSLFSNFFYRFYLVLATKIALDDNMA